MNKNYIFKINLLSCLFIMLLCFAVFSFAGWNFIDGEFVYLTSDGRKMMETFKDSDDGETYYLGSDGYMVRCSMIEYGGDIYYVDAWGRMVKNDYVRIASSNNINRDFEDGVYYFSENGRAYRRHGDINFIRNVNGYYQAFDERGKILVGWLDKDGRLIEDDKNVFDEGYYYANGDGILLHNVWYDFDSDAGSVNTDISESNLVSEKYNDMDSLWIYFDKNCRRVRSDGNGIKTKTINGYMYAFDENGIMVQGFTKTGSFDISQASNPTLNEKIKIYDKEEGNLKKKTWVKTVPSLAMSDDDYNDKIESWFYTNENGSIEKNIIKLIDGKKYVFDGIGRMKSEFVLMADNLFKAQYKSEDLTRDDFIFSITEGGQLYGSEQCDLYYFFSTDNGDGSMCKGDINIDLKDGTYEFRYKKSKGTAYGQHNTLEKSGDYYFLNGLKLCAWDDSKYGIIKVSDSEYVVVNDKGKLIKGNKKLLKDEHENYIVIMGSKLAAYIVNPGDNIKIRWRKSGAGVVPGYYYYNNDVGVKAYEGIAVQEGTSLPTAAQLNDIPKDMRINYR